MAQISHLGSAVARSGTLQYGEWEAFSHPTGHTEFLPVILAQGRQDGPCLWLTAGIHGPEHAGPAVIYRLLNQALAGQALVDQMRGTLVAVPALSPAGLRTFQREPYHVETDPNRLWPDGKPEGACDLDKDPPSSLETAYQRLFEQIITSADCMIDLHAAWTGSIPFAFRDRIPFRSDQDAEANRAAAEALSEKQNELLKAFGHTIVLEMPALHLFDENLHRSASGSVLYLGRIPAFTVELGTGHMPEPAIVAAAVAGIRNVMRFLGMLDSPPEPIQGVKVLDLGYPVRRCSTPRVSQSCAVLHLAQPGDLVKAGDVIAEVVDVWGRPIGDGLVRAEHDGFVIGREHGIYYYPGASIFAMAIPNDAPILIPYPPDYFKPPALQGDSSNHKDTETTEKTYVTL